MAPIEKLKQQPWLIAVAITVLIVAWMLSGTLAGDSSDEVEKKADTDPKPVEVRVRTQSAEPVRRVISLYGRTAPNRLTTVRAETGGRIVATPMQEGTVGDEGKLIARLDMRDRQARLEQAKARVEAAQKTYEAQKRLKGDGYQSETRLADARADLEAARAELEAIRLDIQHTDVVAPYGGRLQKRLVETGDYVAAGDPIATWVDTDPLIVTGSLNENERENVSLGQTADAHLVSGGILSGTIRYIAPVADESTRTFGVELEVPNPDQQKNAGVTADIRIPVSEVMGHKVSPSLLSLNDKDELGIKLVGADDRVQFHKVDVIKSDGDGVWLGGLPETATIITVGGGFVKAGDTVRTVPESEVEQNGNTTMAAREAE